MFGPTFQESRGLPGNVNASNMCRAENRVTRREAIRLEKLIKQETIGSAFARSTRGGESEKPVDGDGWRVRLTAWLRRGTSGVFVVSLGCWRWSILGGH